MKYKIFNVLPEYATNTYLIWDDKTKAGIIIDPAAPDPKLLTAIDKQNIELKYIINTHGHADHIGGNQLIKEKTGAVLAIHAADNEMLKNPQSNLSSLIDFDLVSPAADLLLEDKQTLKFGEQEIKVMHTPGHTRGSISLLISDYLFSGDTLFAGSMGRTDLPGGNHQQIISSIKNKIFKLPEDVTVLPGHGEKTSVAKEKLENPYVGIISNYT